MGEFQMIKVAIIGLDTSHSIEFARRMQDPDCPSDQRVAGLRAITCLRFRTPFQNNAGLDKRQCLLESWGVKVTADFDEAVAGCEAIMLEINDGDLHLPYFKKVAAMGKPVFLDKPLACSLADGRAILRMAEKHKTRVWSGSSLPFEPKIKKAISDVANIRFGHVFGMLNKAAAGDPLIWYGVHSFEMLQRIMGPGPRSVQAVETDAGIVSIIDYGDGRQGVVEVLRGCSSYGGVVIGSDMHGDKSPEIVPFISDGRYLYRDMLREIKSFFKGSRAPVDLAASLEGLAMMTGARKSLKTGKRVKIRV